MEDEPGIPHRTPRGPVDRAADWLERAALTVSMIGVVCAAIVVFLSVVGRALIGRAIPDNVVLTENMMPLIVALPLAYVAARRGHIEVEVFTNPLPPRAIAFLTMIGNLIGLVIFGLIAWSAFNVTLRDFETARYYEGLLRVPAWPAKAFFVIGLALFALRLALNFLEDAGRLFGRRGAQRP